MNENRLNLFTCQGYSPSQSQRMLSGIAESVLVELDGLVGDEAVQKANEALANAKVEHDEPNQDAE